MLNALGLKINTVATFEEAWARCIKSPYLGKINKYEEFVNFATKAQSKFWIFVNATGYQELREKGINYFDYATQTPGPHYGTHGDFLGIPVFSDIEFPSSNRLTKRFIASQKSIIPSPFIIMPVNLQ